MCVKIPLRVIALSNELEDYLRVNLIKDNNGSRLELLPEVSEFVFSQIKNSEEWCLSHGFRNIPIICSPDLRLYFRRLIERVFPEVRVISYLEINPDYKLDVVANIKNYSFS